MRPCFFPTITHVAEDHGLRNGNGTVDVAECMEFLFSAVAQDIVLLDGVQRLLLPFQLDDVGVRNHFLASPLDADALVLVSLGGDHDICLIQDKDSDLLGVNELELGAPVQDRAWRANDDLLGNLLAVNRASQGLS
uniref:Uncharacterized protein n=1 Tax=Varanus komodoensis TaxID=61221 RepID=A0A8D2PZT2_VARKO